MTDQFIVGGCQFTKKGDLDIGDYFEEDVTDGSEDELHSLAAITTSFGTRHSGRVMTHFWAGFETGGRYVQLKRASGKDRRIPLPCGVLGSTDFKGLIKLIRPVTIETGDILAVWTEA